MPAGRAKLDPCPLGERSGADRLEAFVSAAKLITGGTCTPPAAQPLAVYQLGARAFQAQARPAEAVDRVTVQDLGGLAVADERPRAGPRCRAPSRSRSDLWIPRAAAMHRLPGRAPRCGSPPR